jgi:hypothetical protein
MKHPLSGVDRKVIRAQQHIDAIRELVKPFSHGDGRILREHNSQSGLYRWRVKLPDPPDESLSVVIGDCLHNLRSSLDYIVRELVIINNHTPTKNNMFPIAVTQSGWERHLLRDRLCGVSVKAKAVVETLQPKEVTNPHAHPLWHVSELTNIDKHRTLTLTNLLATDLRAAGAGNFSLLLNSIVILTDVGATTTARILRDGAILVETPKDTLFGQEEVEAKGAMFVALQDPPATDLNAVDCLQTCCDFIRDNVIPTFKPFFG